MSLVVFEKWFSELLLYDLSRFNIGDMRIALFSNDVDPLVFPNMVFDDFDPATFDGYDGPKTLNMWSATPGGSEPPRWRITHPPVIWTPTGEDTQEIYGYYVYSSGDTPDRLWWAEARSEGGIVVGTVPGLPYVVIPRYTRRSEFPLDEV